MKHQQRSKRGINLAGLRKTQTSFLFVSPLGSATGTFNTKSGTLSHHAYRRIRYGGLNSQIILHLAFRRICDTSMT